MEQRFKSEINAKDEKLNLLDQTLNEKTKEITEFEG